MGEAVTLAPKPDAAAVRAYRDEHECSIQEAKATLKREWRAEQLADLRLRVCEIYTVEACREVICDLIELLQESDT